MVKSFSQYVKVSEQAAPTTGGTPANPQVSAAQTKLDQLAAQKKAKETELVSLDKQMADLQANTFTNYKVKIEPSGKI